MNTGILVASTGGNKVLRCVATLMHMEPALPVHVTMATDTETYRQLNSNHEAVLESWHVKTRPVISHGFVNGCFNDGIEWLASLGYDSVCLLQDDLVFSPLPEHMNSLSHWFRQDWLQVSGLTFAHFECFTHDEGMRREPQRWDFEDLTTEPLWRDIMTHLDRSHNGNPIYPLKRDWYVRYEGTDHTRPWMRLGPTGFVIPIYLWKHFPFDETYGVYFDIDYTAECRRRDLPPTYAVPNTPWLHLHNQSVRPGGDPSPGAWGDTEGAFAKKFGYKLTDFWHTNWEERWLRNEPFDLATPSFRSSCAPTHRES
jgi:hypothetical protein